MYICIKCYNITDVKKYKIRKIIKGKKKRKRRENEEREKEKN
jgi:hypothetical protein